MTNSLHKITKLKIGDVVVVKRGSYTGKIGKILSICRKTNKICIHNVNVHNKLIFKGYQHSNELNTEKTDNVADKSSNKKHNTHIKKVFRLLPLPIDVSNVMLISNDVPVKVSFTTALDGSKIRVIQHSNTIIEHTLSYKYMRKKSKRDQHSKSGE